ncbi:MAG: YgjP-like metallopeptidase domain-containing protein [Rhizomicrobium sp.]
MLDPDRAVIRVGGQDAHAPRRLADFLKREARKVLEARTRDYAGRIDARVRRVTVRDTSSRWGSCSTRPVHLLFLAPDPGARIRARLRRRA